MSHKITRRQWIMAAAAGTATAIAPNLDAAMPRPLGAQLYTVRNILMKEPDRVLKTIAEIGYTEVEGNRADLVALLPKIQQYGLKPVSCHIETPLITKNWELYPDIKEMDAGRRHREREESRRQLFHAGLYFSERARRWRRFLSPDGGPHECGG